MWLIGIQDKNVFVLVEKIEEIRANKLEATIGDIGKEEVKEIGTVDLVSDEQSITLGFYHNYKTALKVLEQIKRWSNKTAFNDVFRLGDVFYMPQKDDVI